MKSFQFFIHEDLAKELITFVDDHCDTDVPEKVRAFISLLQDEFTEGGRK